MRRGDNALGMNKSSKKCCAKRAPLRKESKIKLKVEEFA